MSKIEKLIREYQPSESVRQLVIQTKIVLLVGISGAGKDTTKQRLMQSSEFADIVSYTTRQPRQNKGIWEREGIDYNYIDEATAARLLESHAFVEAKFVHGTVYGTGVKQIQDIDVQGVDEYKKLSPGVVAIFLLPPNYQEWRRRLSVRYASQEEFDREWPKRYNSAIREITHALEVPYYHFVINDDIDETARIVRAIALKPDVYNRKDDEARLAARDLLEQLKASS